jgi:hypothetical protein
MALIALEVNFSKSLRLGSASRTRLALLDQDEACVQVCAADAGAMWKQVYTRTNKPLGEVPTKPVASRYNYPFQME